jgi:hypothetical protein
MQTRGVDDLEPPRGDLLTDLIRILMRIEAKLDDVLAILEEDDGWEEEEEADA